MIISYETGLLINAMKKSVLLLCRSRNQRAKDLPAWLHDIVCFIFVLQISDVNMPFEELRALILQESGGPFFHETLNVMSSCVAWICCLDLLWRIYFTIFTVSCCLFYIAFDDQLSSIKTPLLPVHILYRQSDVLSPDSTNNARTAEIEDDARASIWRALAIVYSWSFELPYGCSVFRVV